MADAARIELTRRNAALLAEKVAGERAQLLALRAARGVDLAETPAQAVAEPIEERADPATVSNQELREKFAKEEVQRLRKNSLLWKSDTDEAEAWMPRVVRRRG